MSIAGDVFSERELNPHRRFGISSVQDLWEFVSHNATSSLSTTEELPSGPAVFYRGQSNGDFGISSSLYRLCRGQTRRQVTEEVLARSEQAILAAMRREGLGRWMTDGELLMVLQHHGIPTRLVDVSTEPLEALFFATDKEDATDGRLFIFQLPEESDSIDTIHLSHSQELEWNDARVGLHRARATWTKRVAQVVEEPLDPRMRAQKGKFLVGGIVRRYKGMDVKVGSRSLPSSSYADVCTLCIYFPKGKRHEVPKYWRGTGWSIRIKAEWKPELRYLLANSDPPITWDSMYPPLTEVKRLALRVGEDAIAGTSNLGQ